jgi:hypothetical protein
VKRPDKKIKGFVVLPKRWIAERTLGWINRSRRLAKDFEGTIESALAWMQIAFIAILLRRLAYEIIVAAVTGRHGARSTPIAATAKIASA